MDNHPELKVYINPEFSPNAAADIGATAESLGREFADRFKQAANLTVPSPNTSTLLANATASGRAYADAFTRAARVNISAPTAPTTAPAGTRAGQQYADAFERVVKENMRKALASLPDATVNINDATAQAKLTDLRARMQALSTGDIRLNMDSAEVERKITEITAELTDLRHQRGIDIDVDVDIAGALGHMATLQAALHSGAAQAGDSSGQSFGQMFMQHIDALALSAQQGLSSSLSTLIQPISPATIASFAQMAITIGLVGAAMLALIPILAVLVAGLGALLAIGVALGAGMAVLALAIAPLIKQYTELDQKKQAATAAAEKLQAAHEKEAQAVDNLKAANESLEKAKQNAADEEKSAQQSLTDAKERAHDADMKAVDDVQKAEQSLAQTRADATSSEKDAQAQIAEARRQSGQAGAQAAADIKKAEQDLTDVINKNKDSITAAEKAVSDARKQAAQAAIDANKQVEEAEESLADTTQRNADSITEAKQRVADAQQQAAKDTAEANQRIKDAQQSLDEAQKDSLAIDKEVSDQRQQDKRDLAELNDQIKENKLEQLDAAQKMQEAQAALSRAEGTGDGAAIGAAQAGVARAQAAMDSSKDKGTDLIQKQNELRLEGSKALQAAEARQAEQLKKIQEAEENVAKANAARTQTAIDGTRQVEAAQQALSKAQEDAARAQRDAARSVQDAQDAATKAREDGDARIQAAEANVTKTAQANARAQQDAQAAITAARANANQVAEDGQRRIQAAEEAAAKQSQQNNRSIQAAVQALADARANEAKTTVDGQRSIKDAEDNVVKAQTSGAEQVQAAQENVVKATRDVAKAHAETAIAAGDAHLKQTAATKGMSKDVTDFFSTLKEFAHQWSAVGEAAQEQMLPKISEAMRNLQPLIAPLSKFAGEVGSLFGDFAIQASKALTGPWWRQWGTDMGPRILDVLQKMGSVAGYVIQGIAGIAQAFMPLGQSMAGGLANGAKAFSDWAKNLKDNPDFKKFISYVQESVPKIGGILSSAFSFMEKFLKAGAGPGSNMLGTIRDGFVALGKIDYGALKKAIQDYADKIQSALKFLEKWGPTIAVVVGALTAFRVAVTILSPAIKAVQLLWQLANSGFIASPIGIVTMALIALAGILYLFFTRTEVGRKAWNAIVGAFKDGIAWISANWRKPFDAIATFFGKTLPQLTSSAVNTIGNLLSAAGRKIGDVGAWAKSTFVDPFQKVFDSIVNIFDWKKLFAGFDPVNIISNLPGGSTIASMAKTLHIPGFAQGGELPGYASGGFIPGPFLGPRADNVLAVNHMGQVFARVNPREYVIPVEATAALVSQFGTGFLERLRTFDQHRNLFGSGNTPALADGGYVPSVASYATPTVSSSTMFSSGLPSYADGGSVAAIGASAIFGSSSTTGFSDSGILKRLDSLESSIKELAARDIHVSVGGREFATAVQVAEKTNGRGRI